MSVCVVTYVTRIHVSVLIVQNVVEIILGASVVCALNVEMILAPVCVVIVTVVIL